MKRLRWTVVVVAAAGLLAGCGEISNTLTPAPGSANTLTVALDAPPNFSQVGIFEAKTLGYFSQTDLKVRFIVAAHPLSAIESGRAQIAISTEPDIILTRNTHIPLASVAAILQGPQRLSVDCSAKRTSRQSAAGTSTATTPAAAGGAATTTAATSTSAPGSAAAPRSHPPLRATRCRISTQAHPISAYATAPTYNRLDFVVTEHEIVTYAPIIRRFIQAVGRGYVAARADPVAATRNLVKLYPSLNDADQLAGVKASLSDFFPAATNGRTHPWGFQVVARWNAFGTWMFHHKIINDPDAITDADTNELLAGQGV
jgi:putative hydroxymethylpyrimidine transport system substrate-binding protein